jgi:hypothetical protein
MVRRVSNPSRLKRGPRALTLAAAKTKLRDQKGEYMAKVSSYNTSSLEYPPSHRNVYHDHDDCKYGKEIKPQHKEKGEGGKQRCDECKRLG